jgi:hypothetical protein
MYMRYLDKFEKTMVSTLTNSFEEYRGIDFDPWLTADRPQDTLIVAWLLPPACILQATGAST